MNVFICVLIANTGRENKLRHYLDDETWHKSYATTHPNYHEINT